MNRSKPAKSLSQKSFKRTGRTIALVFFALFLIIGISISGFALRAVREYWSARNWEEVPCVIISSKVGINHGSDSTTYRVDIEYEYEYQGRKYRSNRYEFIKVSSSGYSSKKKVVDSYPPGSDAVCYVNPEDPERAVLKRDFSSSMIITFVPVLFAVVGFGGILALYLNPAKNKKVSGMSRDEKEVISIYDTVQQGPVVLKPAQSALGRFIGFLIFAIIWNGIIWTIILISEEASRFVYIFFGIFIIAGAGIAIGALYFFLALFNPKPTLRLSTAVIPLGGAFELSWSFSGRSDRINKLTITLEGREEATYRRGTDTVTDKSVFFSSPLVETTAKPEIHEGSGGMVIPYNTMHSFKADNNKIIWCLRLHGHISKWPDVKQEYPLNILPVKEGL